MRPRATNVGLDLCRLTRKLEQQEARFQKLLDNAPPYMGQTELWIIDLLVSYYKRTQRAKADVERTAEMLRESEKNTLAMMDYLELPPDTHLTALVPGELQFAIWYDEQRMVHCTWTEAEPETLPPNIIVIKFASFPEPQPQTTKKKGQVEEVDDEDDKIDDDTLIAMMKKLYDEDGQPIKRQPEDRDSIPPEFQEEQDNDEVYNAFDYGPIYVED